jgi:vacuolar-type H+-ATPase subunit B/Vma2
MDAGWAALQGLPVNELTRLSDEQIRSHLRARRQQAAAA